MWWRRQKKSFHWTNPKKRKNNVKMLMKKKMYLNKDMSLNFCYWSFHIIHCLILSRGGGHKHTIWLTIWSMLTFFSYLLSSFGWRAFFILFLAFMYDVEHEGQEQFFLLLGFLKTLSYATWNFLAWPKANVFALCLYVWCQT